MTNKIFAKTVKKTTLLSVMLGVVLAAAIVVCALFGFNKAATVDDAKTLTVSMNTYAYNTYKEKVIKDCQSYFGKEDPKYVIEGEMQGDDCEIVFVFDKSADLTKIQATLNSYFRGMTIDGADYDGAEIDISTATEKVTAFTAKHFVLRAVLGGLLFVALAFGYVAIRYKKVGVGLVVAGNVLLSMLMTASLIVLTRILVTTAVASAIALAGLISGVMALLTVAKMQTTAKENEGISNEELVLSSIATKEVLLMGGGLAVAMLVVGIVGRTAGAWFALSAILGLLATTALSLFFAPALYLEWKNRADKRPQKSAYVGAKKTSTKTKKSKTAPVAEEVVPVVEEAKEEVVDEPAEVAEEVAEPVEETTEEAPVEA